MNRHYEEPGEVEISSLKTFLAEKYQQAIVSVCWEGMNVKQQGSRVAFHRRLVFASVEFIPKYFGRQSGLAEHSYKVSHDCRLYHVRHVCNPDMALDWFLAGSKADGIAMIWDGKHQTDLVHFGAYGANPEMQEFPALPELLFSPEVPFATKCWFRVQCAHLLQTDPTGSQLHCLDNTDAAQWICDCLCFDLPKFSEYLGSVNLILPNPYYWHAHISRSQGVNEVYFEVDTDCSNCGLTLLYSEKIGNDQYSIITRREIKHTRERIAGLDQNTADGYAVYDMHGLVWDAMPFTPPILEISGNLGCVTAYRQFECKDKKKQVLPVVRSSQMRHSVRDGLSPLMRMSDSLRAAERRRENAKNDAIQQIYFNNAGDAERRIRALISKGVKNILIIDPYFSHRTAEMFLRAANAPVWVLCGEGGLRDEQGDGLGLMKYIDTLNNEGCEVKVRVCFDNLHDRFLVIDDEAWLLGSSLSSIGDSLSMMIRLENSAERARYLRSFFEKFGKKDLHEYVSHEVS